MSICIKNPLRTVIVAIAMTIGALAHADDYVDSYRYDIGIGLGTSGYLGDANESNLFKNLGFSANAGIRYLFDSRWAAKAQFSMATISGNTANFENVLPENAQYEFSSNVFDLAVKGEANFFAYGIGETYKRLRRWTPYATIGVGVTLASTKDATSVAFSIPMGIGFKFKVSRRLNLNAEFTMTNSGKTPFCVYKVDTDACCYSHSDIPVAKPGEKISFRVHVNTENMPKGETLVLVTLTTNSPLRPIVNLFIAGWID